MKNKITIVTGIILVMFLLYCINQCTHYKNVTEASLAVTNDTLQYYTNRLGTQTAAIQVMQRDNKTLREALINKDKQLKVLASGFAKVRSFLKYTAVTTIDTVSIRYADTVPCVFNRKGKIETKNYSFSFNANQKGVVIDSLIIPDNTTIITGYKRKWIFGKEILVTDVTHSNPYIAVTQMQSAEVTVNVPFYKKWYVWLATGIAGGLVLAK